MGVWAVREGKGASQLTGFLLGFRSPDQHFVLKGDVCDGPASLQYFPDLRAQGALLTMPSHLLQKTTGCPFFPLQELWQSGERKWAETLPGMCARAGDSTSPKGTKHAERLEFIPHPSLGRTHAPLRSAREGFVAPGSSVRLDKEAKWACWGTGGQTGLIHRPETRCVSVVVQLTAFSGWYCRMGESKSYIIEGPELR